MVLRLAESLELPLRERNDSLLAAGYAPIYPQTDLEDPALRPDMAMAGCECALSGTSSRTVEPHCEYWAGRYGCRV